MTQTQEVTVMLGHSSWAWAVWAAGLCHSSFSASRYAARGGGTRVPRSSPYSYRI